MAILKNLIVNGSARFLNTLYANDLTVSGTTTFAGLTTSALTVNGNATMSGTLTLTKTQDLSGTANSSPALIVGGAATSTHIEIDANEIHAKATGTTTGPLYINTDGGIVYLSKGTKISASDGTFTTQTLNVGTTYYFNSSGNINANGITATNANINKGIFHNAVVEGTLYAVHQEIDHVANLGGVFLVTPTVKCISSGSNKTLTSVTVTASSTTRTNSDGESITYNYSLQINDSAFSTASIGGNNWVQYGEVKVSGNINDTVLGTCDGFIQSINTSTHVLTVAIKYNGDQTLATPSDISTVKDLNVMLKTVYDSDQSKHYPVGIWMKSRDANGYSHISLYGGTSVDPTVRIGNLQGLPSVGGVNVSDLSSKWGIYTENGMFSGVIAAKQGIIGSNATVTNNWQIGDRMIYYGSKVPGNDASTLVISTGTASTKSIGGSDTTSKNWMIAAGTGFGVTTAGALYANSGNISGSIIASGIKAGNITSGYLSADRIEGGSLAIGKLSSDAQSQMLNSNIEVGGRNLFSYFNLSTTSLTSNITSTKELQYTTTAGGGANSYQSTLSYPAGQYTINYTNSSSLFRIIMSAIPVGETGWSADNTYVKGALGTDHGYFKDVTIPYTFTVNETFKIGIVAAINNSVTGTIGNLKLEKGNKATDWSPAPEDVDSAIETSSIEYIVGTQTAKTNAWTGVTTSDAIFIGKTIAYYLPYDGTSSAANLNLTLPDGSKTGAKGVRWNNTNVTTHYPAGSIINMTYDGTYWKTSAYNSDTYNRTRYQAILNAANTITASRIICGTSSGYRNIGASVSFDLTYPLLYAVTAIATGATSGTRDNNYLEMNGITYSNNGTITSGAANKTIYLKGTVSGNTFTIAASPFLTTVVPSSDDGCCYIPLGIMTSATVGYFRSSSELWAYKDGAFGPVSLREASAAAKTATNYITAIDSNGIKIHAANNVNSNYAQINANGMEIYKGGTSVASYGDTTRIGSNNTDNKNMLIEQSSIKFNNGSDQIAGMYSSDETISTSAGTNIRTIGTDFALSGEYDMANKEWETPQYAVITGLRRIFPTYIAGCEQLEVASKNEQNPDRSSRTRISLQADDDQTGMIFMELSTGEDESDEDFVSKSFIMSLSSAASSIETNIDKIRIYDEDSGNRIEFDSGNITSAGFNFPCVLPWTFSNQTVTANTRGTISNLPISGLPSGTQIRGVVVIQTPNNHWVRAYAYAQDNTKITINYVNEYSGALTGAFSVLIFFTL